MEVILTGALPIVAYALGDGLITKSNAVTIIKKVIDVVEDGEVTKEEIKETHQLVVELSKKNADKPAEKTQQEEKSETESALEDLLRK